MLAIPEAPVTTSFSQFQEYIYVSKYSRFLHDCERRETWTETVKRYFDFFEFHLKENNGYKVPKELRLELEHAVLNHDVLPSMRCIMTAGPALAKDNIAGYNCSYCAYETAKSIAEELYILMNGTGVGFSVERQYVSKLPEIPEQLHPTDTTIIVADSKLGWAKAFNELLTLLYAGLIPRWDLSRLRSAGAILKTFGGRSSGPEPLNRLFAFVVSKFQELHGNRLTSLDVHDIACMVGECVVVGGVRRSALLSLSNLSDDRMRTAKTGNWPQFTPWRSISNNSAVYTDAQPEMSVFFKEWMSLYESKSGERGIFSRYAARNVIERSNAFRRLHFKDTARIRDTDFDFGCNPCSEILLRPNQFCNLTTIIVRPGDTMDELKRKARLAAILGTWQSTLTNFRFIGKAWKDNTEDERLLGVSMTGIMDNKLLSGKLGVEKLKDVLTAMRIVVIGTNIEIASAIGVPSSTASTCVKPEGTTSSLCDTSAGDHARHSPFYLRTVREAKSSPIAQMMIDQGFPAENDMMRPNDNYIFTFPQKSPKNAIFRADLTAIEHLDLWLVYQKYWADHKPSITVSVREHEWLDVGAWVYKNFEWVSGIAFLPYSDHIYQQAPFQECTEEVYKEWISKTPKADWSKLKDYEQSDQTAGSQELACVGVAPTGEVGCVI